MDERAFKERTKQAASRIISLVEALPRTWTSEVLGKQLLRSGTSFAANYRAACRAKSNAHMISKLSDVEEEADESLFWMEMIIDRKLVKSNLVKPLADEIEQILSMVVASINSLRAKQTRVEIPLRSINRTNLKSKIQNQKSK